jgi:hypothetical protein
MTIVKAERRKYERRGERFFSTYLSRKKFVTLILSYVFENTNVIEMCLGVSVSKP